MEWRGEGVLLAARRHGETSAIIDVLTPDKGRWCALVRGGAGRRLAPLLQPGNQLHLHWRARLAEHLGSFDVEVTRFRASTAMQDREALAILNAFSALCCAFLPEREPARRLYALAGGVLEHLDEPQTRRAAYARWELALLAELGFGLDLDVCAATGSMEELIYVSPRSGKAVSREAGAPYAEKLLPLPLFLQDNSRLPEREDFSDALRLTGFFLESWAAEPLGRTSVPEARLRLKEMLD